MAKIIKIPPKPQRFAYKVELSEAELRHVRSIIGRVSIASLKSEYGEDRRINSELYSAFNLALPDRDSTYPTTLIDKGEQ